MALGREVSLAPGEGDPGTSEGTCGRWPTSWSMWCSRPGGPGTPHQTSDTAEEEAATATDALLSGAVIRPIGAAVLDRPQFLDLITTRNAGFQQTKKVGAAPEGQYHLEVDWNGDPFSVDLQRVCELGPAAIRARLADLHTEIRYTGPHQADRPSGPVLTQIPQ